MRNYKGFRRHLDRGADALGGPAAPVETRETEVPGAAGPLHARLWRGAGAGDLPLVVYLHGGGWVAGSTTSHDRIGRELARRTPAAVLGLDYRLAPEHAYPAALEDAAAALPDVLTRAAEWGAVPGRYVLAGDSAGATLATALAARAALGLLPGLPAPDLQLLAYPPLDGTLSSPSYDRFADDPGLTTVAGRRFYEDYRAGADPTDPDVSPHFATPARLAGTAPAVLVTSDRDILRDEDFRYARVLAAAGVLAEHRHYPGTHHDFLRNLATVPEAADALDLFAGHVRQAFGTPELPAPPAASTTASTTGAR